MAHLAQITVVRNDYRLLTPVTTMYVNTNFHTVNANSVNYQDANGNTNVGTQVTQAWYDGTMVKQFIATEAPSTVKTRFNAANSTDVHVISLTRKNPDGSTTAIQPQIDHILTVQQHPDDNNDSLVMIQNSTNSVVAAIKVDETAAAIATAANG